MNANSISSRRMVNLLRYEWAIDKRSYIIGTLGIFIISFVVFLTIWFNNIEGFVWRTGDYSSIFFGGFIFLSFFGVSQGFIELREKKTAIRYLTLPAGTMEKYLTQVILRLVYPLFVYPIIFSLGANLSVDFYYFIQHHILEKTALPEISKAGIFYLYWNLDASFNEIGTWLVIGIMVSIPMLMFLGGMLFGKWGFIAMPSVIGLFIALMFGSFFGLSWLVGASAFGAGGNYAIRINNPEVFEGVPLFIFACLILIWTAVFLPFFVTYLKLKEREV